MAKPLRALLIDDSEEDAFLLVRYLRKNDYEVESQRVETADALRAALKRDSWDIALCDYVMPLLGGEEALRIVAAEVPDLPVITVSGNVGEEFAVSVMRAGAKDYVRKDNLPRLIPAIERELADAAARRGRHELEDRLREAEIRAETLFAEMEQGVVYQDAEGHIIAANPAATRILGMSLDQMQGRTSSDPRWRAVREDGTPLPGEEHPSMQSLRTRQPTRGVIIGVGIDGSEERRWILVDAVPEFRPGEEAPFRVFTTFTDITERRAREEQIRKSEQRFRALMQAGSDAVYVLSADWSEMRELVGQSFLADTKEPSRGWLEKYVYPEDYSFVRENVANAIRTKSAFAVEHRVLRVDGSVGWTFSRTVPILDAQGEILEWVGMASDVTDRKRADDEARRINAGLEERIADTLQRLHASEERLSLAFRASQDGIWDWNMETGDVWYSDRWGEMLGYAPGELRQHVSTWQSVLHPDDRPWVEEAVAAVMRGERPYDLEFRVRHKDGHYLTVQSRGFPMRRGADGPIVRIVGTHHDITDLKRAESALHAAVDDLESFNYSVSHDLRAPLRHIVGFTEIIEQEFGAQLPAEAQRYFAKVHAGSERMGVMIEALLKLSRIGRAALERRRTDVAALVEQVWADVCSSEEASRVALTVHDLPEVDADPALLRQALDNLLGNALKFTRPVAEPRIEVGAERGSGEPVFYVRDNGVGFDAAHSDRLFAVFQKLHPEAEFEGAGIGLSIVKRIVEKHGGRVWAESAPGHGATFCFTLPPRSEA
ncbi:MAG: PAS domain-containing protein [Candidatus Binatia bacterium]